MAKSSTGGKEKRATAGKSKKASRKKAARKKKGAAKSRRRTRSKSPARTTESPAAAPESAASKVRRVRRDRDATVAQVMRRARHGPFTSRELSQEIGFTSNRARQLLEELRAEGALAPLGVRRGGRGKPATLWGLPGTELSEEDTRVEPKPRSARSAGGGKRGFVARLFKALEKGIKVEGSNGESWIIRLDTDEE